MKNQKLKEVVKGGKPSKLGLQDRYIQVCWAALFFLVGCAFSLCFPRPGYENCAGAYKLGVADAALQQFYNNPTDKPYDYQSLIDATIKARKGDKIVPGL